MDLHSGESILFEGHPSWRSTLAFYIKGIAVLIVVGIIGYLIKDEAGSAIGAGVVLVLLLLAGYIKRASTLYVITNERLHIRRGILSRRVQQTQIDRVQNVNTDQSLLDRMLRVGTVDFDTAGTDDSDFVFRGVSNPEDVVAAVDQARRTATSPRTDV